MKNLKTAVVILVIIPVLIIISQVYLSRVTYGLESTIQQAEACAQKGDKNTSMKRISEFLTKWGYNQHVLSLFVRHVELDYVNQSASKLKPYLQTDGLKSGDFYSECEMLKFQFSHIRETERLSFDNIL